MLNFSFESYGVKVAVDCESAEVLAKTEAIIRTSLLGRLTAIDRASAEHIFLIAYAKQKLIFHLNGKYISGGGSDSGFFNYFETWVRLTVAEFAPRFVFIHAGVVVWKGKAIMFPADSFCGKTSIVAEFVRRGATYYSDEYAVIDQKGLIHPFPRLLSIRDDDNDYERIPTSAESLGGTIGAEPIPASLIIFTRYEKYARWQPERLTPGIGLMKIVPQAISVRINPKFTLLVLKRLSNRAILVQSYRGDSKGSVNKMISFVDKLFF